jgi:hypothetical protein
MPRTGELLSGALSCVNFRTKGAIVDCRDRCEKPLWEEYSSVGYSHHTHLRVQVIEPLFLGVHGVRTRIVDQSHHCRDAPAP